MGENERIFLDAKLLSMIKDGVFRAELANGHRLVAYSKGDHGGEIRSGDAVRLRMSPYDMSQGMIVERLGSRGDFDES